MCTWCASSLRCTTDTLSQVLILNSSCWRQQPAFQRFLGRRRWRWPALLSFPGSRQWRWPAFLSLLGLHFWDFTAGVNRGGLGSWGSAAGLTEVVCIPGPTQQALMACVPGPTRQASTKAAWVPECSRQVSPTACIPKSLWQALTEVACLFSFAFVSLQKAQIYCWICL